MKRNYFLLFSCVLTTLSVKADHDWVYSLPARKQRVEFGKDLMGQYPLDMGRYKDDNLEASPEGTKKGTKTVSCQLFNHYYKEFDRAVAAEHVALSLASSDYREFVKNQAKPLSPENFIALREKFLKDMGSLKRFNTLRALLRVNDIGKPNGTLAQEIEKLEKKKISDHDKILWLAIHKYPALVPSIDELPNDEKKLLSESYGTELNIAQFNQAESVVAEVLSFLKLSNGAKKIAIWEKFADFAGAAGGTDAFAEGSIINDVLYGGFNITYEHLIEKTNVQSACKFFEDYIADRCQGFGLDVQHSAKDFAVGCLAIRARKHAGNFAQFKEQFEKQSTKDRIILVDELGKNGIDDVAIKIEYSPAIFVNAEAEFKQEGIDLALKVTAQIYSKVRKKIVAARMEKGVITVHAGEIAAAIKDKAHHKALTTGNFVFEATEDGFKIAVAQEKPEKTSEAISKK